MAAQPKRTEFGRCLKTLRLKWKLSQQEMAKKIGVADQSYYSSIERASRGITVGKMLEIKQSLGPEFKFEVGAPEKGVCIINNPDCSITLRMSGVSRKDAHQLIRNAYLTFNLLTK